MPFYCLLHEKQLPLCGFSTKDSAAKYRAENLTSEGWTIHYFDGKNYSDELK